MTPAGERLARVEAHIEHLEENFSELSNDLKLHRRESIEAIEKLRRENTDALKKISDDLSGLLELKQRGQGAFWLVATIVGSGFIGVMFGLWELFNGKSFHG